MKNYKWLIVLGIVILILIVVSVVFSDNEDKYLKEVSIDKVLDMKENDESFILYIKQTNCEHCKVFTPRFVNVLKEKKLKAYVLNLTDLSTEDNKKYENNFDIKGTPTVLFFDNGDESLIKIQGEQTKEQIISKIESAGFLK